MEDLVSIPEHFDEIFYTLHLDTPERQKLFMDMLWEYPIPAMEHARHQGQFRRMNYLTLLAIQRT